MGGSYVPEPLGKQTAESLQALVKYLPDYLATLNQSRIPTAQAELEAQKAVAPGYYQNSIDMYNKYGTEMNRQAADQDRANRTAGIQTDLGLVQGQGGQLAQQALGLLREADPEYYARRALVSDKLGEYVNSISPNQLTGSERSEIERGLARTNPGRADNSAINTVQNAMTYGSALKAKRDELGNAINMAANALPSLRSNADVFGIATGRAGLSGNSGDQRFAQAGASAQNASNTGFNAGQAYGNQINANQMQRQQIMAAGHKSFLDDIGQGIGAFSNLAGGFKSLRTNN